ncbi:hypothetical protein TSUD_26320 [Trifolium subterraneum]|uniref:Uncharacterized protein n=1 Tax=Trifolium subterraneum TaxID=3900 RepID=A0A2Z6NWQ8_TRISU|nr:hypothetical protein TSUD_26320 [Trifolium subterraneum]
MECGDTVFNLRKIAIEKLIDSEVEQENWVILFVQLGFSFCLFVTDPIENGGDIAGFFGAVPVREKPG